jgi:hypothetical protein
MKFNGMHTDKWGSKRWYKNGQYHREDGPAVEYEDGSKFWHVNGERHRLDGPAYEDADGSKAWYVNDSGYSSFDEWLEAVDVSDEQKVFLKLKWT